MRCSPILTLLAIARLASVDWDVTGNEWFSSDDERPSFVFISPVPGVTRERWDGSEVTEGSHDEILPVYC